MKKQIKSAVVFGGGSIGKRHIQNLKFLGVTDISLIEQDDHTAANLVKELGILRWSSVEEIKKKRPDMAMICVPTHMHFEFASRCIKEKIPTFVEKPAAHELSHANELAELSIREAVPTMVGCNMRFHPGPKKVKEWLEAGAIGKIFYARIHTSSYLPEWRPGTDYKKSYSAKTQLGGGVLLDCIHEIDLATWYLGPAKLVNSIATTLSDLQIEAEDFAMVNLRHGNGAVSHVHLDFIGRTYERGCHIVGSNGSLFWDFREKRVRLYHAETKHWTEFAEPTTWDINEMYIDELKSFISSVQEGRATVNPISEATRTLSLALNARKAIS